MFDTLWSMFAWLAVGLAMLLYVPMLTYLTVKLGTIGFYHGRKDFLNRDGDESHGEG